MFKPYFGLSSDSIQRIQSVYPTLKRIETITHVPWQAMAGIWYRESFSVTPPRTPGGPFQFDLVPSPGALRGLLDRFTDLSDGEKRDIVAAGVNPFFSGGVLAACFLRTKTRAVIHPAAPDGVIMDAMWGYNGKAYGSAQQSPYVYNGMDAEHYPLRLVGTLPDGKGGRKQVAIDDGRPGAFTVYKQLKALFP